LDQGQGGDAEIAGVDIAGEGKMWKAKVLKMCFWLYWLKIALWYSLV